MGPDIVECVEESPTRAVYRTIGLTTEDWDIEIIATNKMRGVNEVVGRRYAVRWGFLEDEDYGPRVRP